MQNHLHLFAFNIIAFVLVCNGCYAEDATGRVEEKWQTIWNQNQRIGYAHSTIQQKSIEGEEVVITDTLVSMSMTRFGQTLTIRQKLHHEELSDGTLLRSTSVLENPPNSRKSVSAEVDGDEIALVTKVAGKETEVVFREMQGVRSPAYQERYIEQGKLKEGEVITFDVFEAELGGKSEFSLVYRGTVGEGEDRGLREVLMRQSIPGVAVIESKVYCREDWLIQKVVSPLLQMEMRAATAKEALEPIGNQELDFALDTMVRVDGLSNVQTAKSITYRVEVEGNSPTDIFEESERQSLRKTGPNRIEMKVISVSLPKSYDKEAAVPEIGDEFLNSSKYLETDSQAIQSLAAQTKATGNPVDTAVVLENFVKSYVVDKNFSTAIATAAEVAESKAGDCTEHAVLLAALLRVNDIPSRVAIGFVYSPQHQAFVGHMWTEAFLAGKWFPLDATTGRAKTGAGYLTISTSSLSDDGLAPVAKFLPMLHLLGRTKIDVVEVIW